jgi:hypothetical protein
VGCCSYQLYRLFQTPHSFSVTIFTFGFRLFFILLQINLTSMGHRVKIHKITPATGKERGDLEIKDYVVFWTSL